MLDVNKGESVKEIDLPDQLAPDLKAHIDGACAALFKAFPEMHKPSERCRPPHIHRDTVTASTSSVPRSVLVAPAHEERTRI